MSEFNAARARAKRPCPLWVDAFQRDTQHLEADEVGAYMLILMAMWTRESCDFPDDDTRLARVSRVSVRLWKSRVGPVLRAFFQTENGALISKRLRQEATYTERQVTQQSDRKRGEKTDKPLENNETAQTADISTEPSAAPSYPTTQLPNIKNRDTNVSLGHSFADFWKVWPNKVAKASAEKAWKKLKPEDRKAATDAAVSWFASWQKKHADASPIHPATYLNQRRWTDLAPVATVDNSELWAKAIRGGQGWAVKGLSPEQCRKLVDAGLVTNQELRAVGLTQ